MGPADPSSLTKLILCVCRRFVVLIKAPGPALGLVGYGRLCTVPEQVQYHV